MDSPKQEESQTEKQKSPIQRFLALDPRDQSLLLARIERVIALSPNDRVQAIVSLGPERRTLPLAEKTPFHKPKRWAKGVAKKRRVLGPKHPMHRALKKRVPQIPFLEKLHKSIWYDWRSGKIVRRKEELNTKERFENLLAGYPPGTDSAVAFVLASLDKDETQRKHAECFGHLYADLSARVFEGVTLYEAWYSGRVLDVPDVDAIAFERKILGSQNYRSPIPKGRKRNALYQKIQDHVLSYRKYRSLLEAAAAAFVSAKPEMDPIYVRLVPRFHLLFAMKDDDVARVAHFLDGIEDRKTFIEELDREVSGDDGTGRTAAYAKRERRRKELVEMATSIRTLAIRMLKR